MPKISLYPEQVPFMGLDLNFKQRASGPLGASVLAGARVAIVQGFSHGGRQLVQMGVAASAGGGLIAIGSGVAITPFMLAAAAVGGVIYICQVSLCF